MATLAAGVKESDEFRVKLSEICDIFEDEDNPWRFLSEALRKRGVCVFDWCSASEADIWHGLLSCRTCGDALALLGPAEPQQQEQWNADMKAANRAWLIEYVASEPVLDLMDQKLNGYFSMWEEYRRYAPLVPLVQSSGWGKSRLMCQLWRKGYYVFYISCMPRQRIGFPRRTEKLADVLTSQRSGKAAFSALVVGILKVFNARARDMTCREWIDIQLQSSVIQQEVYDVYLENLKTIQDDEFGIERAFRQEIDKLAHGMRLLLCVDEAGELGDNFEAFRMSLKCIPHRNRFFCVVVGTELGLDKVIEQPEPALIEDRSARVRWALPYRHPYHLYDLLYLIGKSDIFAKDGTDVCNIIAAPEDVVRYGRPLWAAYYDSVVSADKLSATILFAKVKLLGGNMKTSESGWVTEDIAVAVFACMVGLDVDAWGSLPQQLAANHMGNILKISADRRRVYTAAAMEPVLAAAAAQLLHAENDAFLGEFLDKLIVVIQNGLVHEGIRGELAIRIIMLLAVHECTKGQHYIQPVTLARFLETMFGKSIVDKLKENCCNVDDYLFFNSFTPLSTEPFKRLVEKAFARCTALFVRRNENTLDIVLPLRDTSSDVAAARSIQATVKRELEDQEMKGIVVPVQLKNRGDEQPMKSAIEELQNDDMMTTPVQLFFQLGQGAGRIPEVNHSTVVCYGIDCFQHLKSQKMQELKVVDRLKLLSRTCENIFKDATSEQWAALEALFPLGLVSNSYADDLKEDNEPLFPLKWKPTKRGTEERQHHDVQRGNAEDAQVGKRDTKVQRTEDAQV